jgi:cytochrome c
MEERQTMGRFRRLIPLALLGACGQTGIPPQGIGGDPARGEIALRQYACPTCHIIPGMVGAHGLAGPPLTQWPRRAYIAGILPNTPDNLVRWLRDPQEVSPANAMPNLGVTERDARDMAAYLYRVE